MRENLKQRNIKYWIHCFHDSNYNTEIHATRYGQKVPGIARMEW
jgi:hypothetical protein